MNEHVVEDLTRLRDELAKRAFDQNGRTLDSTLAEVVFKINSCLFKGYPRREVKK
jgi:methyltransferase-like protein